MKHKVIINLELLEKSPLRPPEKELLREVYIEGRSLAEVARKKGVTRGTVSILHKKALERFNSWIGMNKAAKILTELIDRGYTLDDVERFLRMEKEHEDTMVKAFTLFLSRILPDIKGIKVNAKEIVYAFSIAFLLGYSLGREAEKKGE